MSRFIFLIFLLVASCTLSAADSLTTAIITITNNPVLDGDSLAVNASTRTWRTTPTVAESEVTIGASIGANATNLFSQLAAYPLSGLTLGRYGTNGITLQTLVNGTLSITIATNWGTYSLSTQTVSQLQVIRVPFASVPGATNRTNQASLLVTAISDYATNSIASGVTALSHYLADTGTQTMAGDKTFTGLVTLSGGGLFSGVINQAEMTNSHIKLKDYTTFSPNNGHLTFRDAADLPVFDLYSVAGNPILSGALTTPSDLMLLNRTNAEVVLGSLPFANIWVSDQTWLGTNHYVHGSLAVTNALDSLGSRSLKRGTHSSMANGDNSGVVFDGSEFWKVIAGPTAAFGIVGIDATSAKDGQHLIVYNSIAQNLTVKNQSGVEPTAANRIVTMTGADVTSTTLCTAEFIYDSNAARWLLIGFTD